MSDYKTAIEAAGAEVHEFESFGSYQGDWWAKVSYDGKVGWVSGSYGSCSGCDSFEATFGWREGEECDEHRYEGPQDCDACRKAKEVYREKLAAFGREYLDDIMTQEKAEAKAAEHIEWDMEAKDMVKFIKEHPIHA